MMSIDVTFITYLSTSEVRNSLPTTLEITPSNEFEFHFYGENSSPYFHQDKCYSSSVSAFKPNGDGLNL